MDGNLMAPRERLTLDQALRAVTSDAAFVLRMEDRIGSIRAGKSADFTVLERDPYEVGVAGLADIPVWGTVFEGRLYPVAE
jgi:predicted amidohydrolase YtcJ